MNDTHRHTQAKPSSKSQPIHMHTGTHRHRQSLVLSTNKNIHTHAHTGKTYILAPTKIGGTGSSALIYIIHMHTQSQMDRATNVHMKTHSHTSTKIHTLSPNLNWWHWFQCHCLHNRNAHTITHGQSYTCTNVHTKTHSKQSKHFKQYLDRKLRTSFFLLFSKII